MHRNRNTFQGLGRDYRRPLENRDHTELMAGRRRTNRIPFAAFRARAAKLGLQVSWLMLAAVLFAAYRLSLLNDPRVWVPSLLAGVGLLALSFIRWERALQDWRGDLFLWLWLALILAELTTVGAVPQLSPMISGLYFAVVVLSAALAGIRPIAGSDVGYPPMPQTEYMLHGHPCPLNIIGGHGVEIVFCGLIINQHNRDFQAIQMALVQASQP